MKLVDLSKFSYILEPRYYFWGWSDTPKIYARESLAKTLAEAHSFLPKGYNFKIWDAWRSRKIQMLMLASFKKRLRIVHPKLSKGELEKILYTFGARPVPKVTRLDSHRTGGAIDLTIVDAKGRELYMGTDHDDLTDRAALDFFEKNPPKTSLDILAKKNRQLIKRVMRKAGFLIYAPEWWHWSLDR